MHKLPDTGFLRIRQIVGDPKANPPIAPLIPVSKSTWWNGCQFSALWSHFVFGVKEPLNCRRNGASGFSA